MSNFDSQHSTGGGELSKGVAPRGFRRFFSWRWLFLVTLTSILLIVGGCIAVFIQGQTIDEQALKNIDSSSVMMDSNGREVLKIGNTQREYVKLSEVRGKNQKLIDAFVLVEDRRFFSHSGVDFRAMWRAVWANIKGHRQGAGTITMQVARNVILDWREQTIARKMTEVATAWNIERAFSKETILEAYLNFIDFGNNISGIQMASKVYFNKDLRTDSLAPHEIALLAGLPKAPSDYNPFGTEDNKRKALDRRNLVLSVVKTAGDRPLFTKAETDAALKQKLITTMEGKKYLTTNSSYAAYRQLVEHELKTRYDISSQQLKTNKYRVYTGLDTAIQTETERVLNSPDSFLGPRYKYVNAGTATIDLKKGLVAAIGGGRNYKLGDLNQGGFQVKSAGSSMKPLTVFAPAIEKSDGEINEYSIVVDKDPHITGWHPKNWDRREHGEIPMREVVEQSYNLGTLWLLKNKVGLDYSFDKGIALGLNLHQGDKRYDTLGLGAFQTGGVTPLQMARAYTVFPQNGTRIHARAIERVEVFNPETKSWEVVEPENGNIVGGQVYSPKTTWYMTRLMQGVAQHGTGRGARLTSGRPLAVKTGTTNMNREAWLIGYTPQYVTSVMTYTTESIAGKSENAELVSSRISMGIFRHIMDRAHVGKRVEDFRRPAGVSDPIKPFELEEPAVTGRFNLEGRSIDLSWAPQTDRVRFEVEKKVHGNFVKVADVPGSAASYRDRIDLPSDNPFTGPPPGFNSPVYVYRVIAIDTQADSPAFARKISNEITVVAELPPQPDNKCTPDNPDYPNCLHRPPNGPDCAKDPSDPRCHSNRCPPGDPNCIHIPNRPHRPPVQHEHGM